MIPRRVEEPQSGQGRTREQLLESRCLKEECVWRWQMVVGTGLGCSQERTGQGVEEA